MGWQDLLSKGPEARVFPWIEGRDLRLEERIWSITGKLPAEMGWWTFNCDSNRKARLVGPAEAAIEGMRHLVKGYLVGDRLVCEDTFVNPDPTKIAEQCETVYLIEPGLDRFARIVAGRFFSWGPLIFQRQDFPLGPDGDVLNAFLEEKDITNISGVTPALEAAFRLEVFQREETRKRRAEAERKRREEEERLARDARRKELIEKFGSAETRRELARLDFGEAARAALAVGNATYLDHRPSPTRHEMIVRFRFQNRRFEATCDDRTLQVIDSGICLTAHYDDPDFDGGTEGDSWFTLESLPSVIGEAIRAGRLVIHRHLD